METRSGSNCRNSKSEEKSGLKSKLKLEDFAFPEVSINIIATNRMDQIRATIAMRNPRDRSLAPLTVKALVDTGALHLCIPEHLAIRPKLDRFEEREVTTADGVRHHCAYVGPIEVHFGNSGCFTGALVLGDEILLGAVPMEDVDLIISPTTRSGTVNPECAFVDRKAD